jgi:predicted enzyme related to lactoylglutathione lyase
VKRVTSIGGIFFKTKNPDQMKEWYAKHLGLKTDQYGACFEWRLSDEKERKGYTQWSTFKEDTTYFAPSNKDFMINYRVESLEELVKVLKEEGVTIVDSIEEYEYGKFVHIMDPEGNKIELWEPKDEWLDENQRDTNK